jgi:hypothetical protein
MKNITIQFLILLTFLSCEKQEETIHKKWLGREIDFKSIVQVINTYHMFDSTGAKVGSMVYGMGFEDGSLIARDTSQFDDGSVYETAEFLLDTSDFTLKEVYIDMNTSQAILDVDLSIGSKVKGTYNILQDTTQHIINIDSAYNYSVFRSELYMLLHTYPFEKVDTISLKALVPTSMGISSASLIYEGEEKTSVPAGSFLCDVVLLKTDGKMPENRIWIRKSNPRCMVKFVVPSFNLSIELVEQAQK